MPCYALNQIANIPIVLLSLVLPISFNTSSKLPHKPDDGGKCELVGTFSLLTQAFLGLICLSSLILKRSYEHPLRRSWSVWSFDVLKQLIGALGVHVFNVFLSILKTRDTPQAYDTPDEVGSDDPCDWYFLSIMLDCTIGVYVLYLVFKGLNKICRDYFKMTLIESGKYGPDPNKPSTTSYLKQLSIYFTSLMITKFILYALVECFETELLWFTSHVILLWLDEYPDELEIFVVMFIVPIVMNCLQLILVDNIIQNQSFMQSNKKALMPHGHVEGVNKDELGREIASYGTFEEV